MIQGEPVEISIPARQCGGTNYYHVGDFVVHGSAVWMVKGLYFGASQNGQRELYYIMSEATASFRSVEAVRPTRETRR